MKKIGIFLLVFSMFVSFSLAEGIESTDVYSILSGMEIISSDFNLEASVTRVKLAEILVKASTSKNLAIGTNRMSVFSDVPYNLEGAGFIRVAAVNGYLTAYIDGEFKPSNIVKTEEAITATLKLLGYTNKDFSGAYPYEQLSIARELELTKGIDTTIGKAITNKDLQRLIYNALTCTVKGGNKKHIETLGYTLSTDTIALGDVMSKSVTGPVTYTSKTSLGNLTNPTVYVDGKVSSLEELEYYDVIYYSENSNTIWAYRDRVTGMVEGISPNMEAPTSVTISGKSYKLSTYSAKKAFTVSGFSLGNMVTVLLDRNGEVCDAYLTESLYKEQVGVILSTGKGEKLQSNGKTKVTYYATVLLSTGEKLDISTNSDYSKKVGYTAKISIKNGKASIYSTRKTTDIKGTFSLEKGSIGSKYKVSGNVSIIEVDDFGNTLTVYPERLDGVMLNENNVALVTKNNNNVITSMIIKNVTGDTAKYGILSSVNENKMSDSESYTCVVDGNSKNYSNSDITFNVEEGPVQIYMDGQSLGEIKNLDKVESSIVNVNNAYIELSGGDKLKVSSNVVVYIKTGLNYELSTMDEAMSGEYSIKAYYDEEESKGGRIRVIIIS